MSAVGVSGHRMLPDRARDHAETVIRGYLATREPPLLGLSSLAEGADQLFARIVLELGGRLHAVLPSTGYAATMAGTARAAYDRLLASAAAVTTLAHPAPTERAFHDAGRYVVEHSDALVAVWDGRPARGPGGTGDAVALARELSRPVVVAWPAGLVRP